MSKRYASKLTKQELIQGGITNITADGRVFKNEVELIDLPLNPSGYKYFSIYDRDENGCCIKRYYPKRPGYFTYKCKAISLQRAMWAWFNEEVPEGYVVDHINANKNDYRLDNLQLLTPKANVNKEKINWHTKEIKCKINKPRSFYEDKLARYEKEYEQAKKDHNAKLAHKLRGNLSDCRARLRYYDNHIKEVNEMTEFKKDCLELAYWKKNFKNDGNKAMWRECCKVEKIIKERKEEAAEIVKHALEVLRNVFGD